MKIVGLVATKSKFSFDKIAKELGAVSERRYGCRIIFRPTSECIGIFHSEEAVTEALPQGLLAYSGYITASADQVTSQVLSQFNAGDDAPVRISNSLGGTHCIVSAQDNEAIAWCSRPGCSPPYVFEGEDFLVVSSRPGLLKETFRLKPDYEYFKWVASIGYPIDNTSPYQGCKAILAGTALRITGHRSKLVAYKLPPHGVVPKNSAEADEAEEIARQEILRACSVVGQHPDAIFRLSGGKDSRLVASALHALKLPCNVRTSGGGEGEIASKVSNIGGFSFSLETPVRELNSSGPVEAAKRALSETDGFIRLQGHKSLNTRPFIDTSPSALIMGQIELTKGGYAKGKVNVNMSRAKTALANYVLTDIPKNRRELEAWLEDFFDYASYSEPLDLLYFPYSETRASRYLEVSYLHMSRHTTPIFPPNDERMYLAISNVDRKRRASERFMYKMIATNSPEMASLPIYGSKWKFSSGIAHAPERPIEAEASTDGNPFHSKASLDIMRDHIKSNKGLLHFFEEAVSRTVLEELGLLSGSYPSGSTLKRNKKLKVLMRLFIISVAIEQWEEV